MITTEREAFDSGSKSWGDFQRDKYQYDFDPSFPARSPARSTFYARDVRFIGDKSKRFDSREHKFERLFPLQHGRRHTYEDWGRQKIRPENVFTYRRACVLLSQAEVSDQVRNLVLAKVMTESLVGFNRYYQGIDGATLGFAALYQYEDIEEAKGSYIKTVAENLLECDTDALIEYVWKKYG